MRLCLWHLMMHTHIPKGLLRNLLANPDNILVDNLLGPHFVKTVLHFLYLLIHLSNFGVLFVDEAHLV